MQQWDTTPDYWNNRYTSKEAFRDSVAPTPSLDSTFFSDEIMRWVQSDKFAAWQAAQPVPPDYGPPDFGDYTVIQGGVYVFDFALIRDDHGRFYLNYGNSYGIPGVSIVRGKILVKTAEGYQDIDQLDVTWDQKSTIMSEALTGEARSIAGGYPYITFGYSAGINPPYYRFVEGGIFISPSPVSLSFSPLNTTFSLSGR